MASSNNKRDPRFWNKTNSHLFGDVSIEEESNYVFNVHKYNIGNNSSDSNDNNNKIKGSQYLTDIITPLPNAYEWSTINIIDEELEELRIFLSENYLEAEDIYRYDLSIYHIQWILMFPNYSNRLHLGMRQKETQKLVGFISATPSNITMCNKSLSTGIINLLCVRKDKRYKNFVPLLIQEIRRRLGTSSPIVPTALYTLERPLGHFPVTTSKCYHKSLNIEKLIEIGWTTSVSEDSCDNSKGKRESLNTSQILERYLCLDCTTPEDVINKAYCLWKQHVSQGKLYQNLTLEEFIHIFIFNSNSTSISISDDKEKEKVISTYYLLDETGEVTDITSFYHVPMTLLNNSNSKTKHNHSHMYMAFSFHSCCY